MPPAIVLLPGMDGTGELFSPFLASLGSEFETLIIRYPTNRPLGYGELAALTQSQLPTDKQYVLLAESFSGPIAISIAASNPIGLAGIILCASFAKNPRPKLRYLMPLLAIVPPGWIPRAVLSQLFFGRFAREGPWCRLKRDSQTGRRGCDKTPALVSSERRCVY